MEYSLACLHLWQIAKNLWSYPDNGVRCWGYNDYGQTDVPTDLVNPKAVAAGDVHTCAIDDKGVQCWGDNGAGQTDVPTNLVNPKAVASQYWHTCALDDNGVQCWGGRNEDGQTTVPTNLMFDPDGDGVTNQNGLDAFPFDATEDTDTDSDGTGNNADTDDDNDGVLDTLDVFPLDATETVDSDGDGIGNNSDLDDDADGILDSADSFPLDSEYSIDSDGDGMPDAWETRYGLDPNDASDATSDQDNDGVTALDEFLAGTIPSGSLDIDGNGNYDALTDGLLLLRGMFGLDGSALVTGTIAPDAAYTESVDIESRIATLGDLADIDGNGEIDALTDGLLTLRYLFGLQGDTLINGVVAGDATRKTAEEIEAHLETLMPAL
jgi:hypothetical protein